MFLLERESKGALLIAPSSFFCFLFTGFMRLRGVGRAFRKIKFRLPPTEPFPERSLAGVSRLRPACRRRVPRTDALGRLKRCANGAGRGLSERCFGRLRPACGRWVPRIGVTRKSACGVRLSPRVATAGQRKESLTAGERRSTSRGTQPEGWVDEGNGGAGVQGLQRGINFAECSIRLGRIAWLSAVVGCLLVSSVVLAQDGTGQNSGADQSQAAIATLPEVTIEEKALDTARAQISPSLGATTYTLDSEKIDSQSQGEFASFNQTFYRFPGVVLDELDKRLHVRGEEANLQYRINACSSGWAFRLRTGAFNAIPQFRIPHYGHSARPSSVTAPRQSSISRQRAATI